MSIQLSKVSYHFCHFIQEIVERIDLLDIAFIAIYIDFGIYGWEVVDHS